MVVDDCSNLFFFFMAPYSLSIIDIERERERHYWVAEDVPYLGAEDSFSKEFT